MQRAHRRAHLLIWSGIACVLPLALIVLMWMRPDFARARPAIQIGVTSAPWTSAVK